MKTPTPLYRMMVIDSSQIIAHREDYQRELKSKRVKRVVSDFDERIANEPKVTTLKSQIETAASINPDGTVRMETATPKKSEYEQQIEELQDGKRLLFERYLMGEIDLDTYKSEKAACDELLLKTKNTHAAISAQAKQTQEEQSRQDNRKEAKKAIFDADTLTTELADLLIERVLVYPDNRIEVAYKVKDIFE